LSILRDTARSRVDVHGGGGKNAEVRELGGRFEYYSMSILASFEVGLPSLAEVGIS
jgi:hypothetical protein